MRRLRGTAPSEERSGVEDPSELARQARARLGASSAGAVVGPRRRSAELRRRPLASSASGNGLERPQRPHAPQSALPDGSRSEARQGMRPRRARSLLELPVRATSIDVRAAASGLPPAAQVSVMLELDEGADGACVRARAAHQPHGGEVGREAAGRCHRAPAVGGRQPPRPGRDQGTGHLPHQGAVLGRCRHHGRLPGSRARGPSRRRGRAPPHPEDGRQLLVGAAHRRPQGLGGPPRDGTGVRVGISTPASTTRTPTPVARHHGGVRRGQGVVDVRWHREGRRRLRLRG